MFHLLIQHNGEGSSRNNISSNISTPSTHSEKHKVIPKRKKASSNIKSPQTSYTLDRYFLSKEKETSKHRSKCMSRMNQHFSSCVTQRWPRGYSPLPHPPKTFALFDLPRQINFFAS